MLSIKRLTAEPAPPPMGEPTRDLTADTARITAANPIDSAFRDLFARYRIHQLRASPGLDEPTRVTMAEALAHRLRGETLVIDGLPAPGGLGVGFYYKPEFREAWKLGTGMGCEYVCPHRAGGDSRTYLYLTSMNRAAWGCEPLVLYPAQDAPRFMIFDWALANQGKRP
jgi:hypothetical protein